MLPIGSPAPDLTLNDQNGKPFTLSHAWRDRNVVLFFYPKAGTAVCTKEACSFRDALADVQAHNAMIIGVSSDSVAEQRAFGEQWKLPFVLLSDPKGALSTAYGARKLFGLFPGRVTYVIDRKGIIRGAYSAMLEAEGHVQQALATLEAQGRS